jgi:hypothetical protein
MLRRAFKSNTLIFAIIAALFIAPLLHTSSSYAQGITYQNFRHKTSPLFLYSNDHSVFIDGTRPYGNDVKDPANWQILSNGSYRLFRNSITGLCLDSNMARQVYTNSCSLGNHYQNWLIIPNGRYILIKNRNTGYCLDAGQHYVYTNACSRGNDYMNWF